MSNNPVGFKKVGNPAIEIAGLSTRFLQLLTCAYTKTF